MEKVIIYCLLAGLLTISACHNKKEKTRADEENVITAGQVPAPVKTAFAAKYPGATEIIWENASEGHYPTKKVKFKIDGKYWKAEYRPDGSLVKEKEDE